MFKHYFEQIHDVAIWPIISLSIFFIFFLCLSLWALTANKTYIQYMSQLPMGEEPSEKDTNSKNSSYE